MRCLSIVVPFVFFTAIVFGQEEIKTEVLLNGNFQVGVPLQDFQDNLGTAGFGGGGLLAVQIARSPVYAGLELSGMVFDSQRERYSVNIGGFFRDYELRTSSNIFLGHALIRIKPDVAFPLRPYFDGMIGFKNLYTRTKLIDREDPDDTILESDTDKSDWAFSYGGAAGVQLAVFGNPGILLDLRCAYLPGANASYLVRKEGNSGDPYNDPIDAFEEKTSPTHLLLPQIGITFNLSFLAQEE